MTRLGLFICCSKLTCLKKQCGRRKFRILYATTHAYFYIILVLIVDGLARSKAILEHILPTGLEAYIFVYKTFDRHQRQLASHV